MKMGTDAGASRDQVAKSIIQVPRVERTQPKTSQSLNLHQIPEKPGQCVLGVQVEAIGGEMDAAENDLPEAPGNEPARPSQEFFSSKAPARPPHRGDDAKGAAQGTAVLGLEQSAGAQGLSRRAFPG